MNDQNPRVSAVIPTRNRAEMVCRAVRSVLAQTMPELECIVVVDGPDGETMQALTTIADARLRVLALEENVGGCEARNLGAQASRGAWVALLDDDDEWLPQRLERQLAVASDDVTLIASRYLDRSQGSDDLVKPLYFPGKGQDISEFLWCEVGWCGGIVGFPQTSTWLVRRDFLLQVPFTRGLKALQDLDWLLRSYPHPRMNVKFVEEPLTIFHNESGRQRVTKRIDWQFSHRWANANRHLFTPLAFSFFLVVFCVNPAAQQEASWSQRKALLRDVRRYGRFNLKLANLCLLYTCFYPWLSKLLAPRQRSAALYWLRNVVAFRSSEVSSLPRARNGF